MMKSISFSLLLLQLICVWQSEDEHYTNCFCHGFVIPNNNRYSNKNVVISSKSSFGKQPIRIIVEPFSNNNDKRRKVLLWSSRQQKPPLLNNTSTNDAPTSLSTSSQPKEDNNNSNNSNNYSNDTSISSKVLETMTIKKDDDNDSSSLFFISTTKSARNDAVVVVEEEEEEKKELMFYSSLDMDDPRVEISSGLLVLISSLLAAITTLPSLDVNYLKVLNNVEQVITVLFATEFILRWISYYNDIKKNNDDDSNVLKYLLQPLSLVDLASIWLPLVLTVMHIETSKAALVNLRLLRILRLRRVLESEENFSNFIMATLPGMSTDGVRPYQLQLARVILSIFTLLSISTGFIYSAEHTVNPQIPDYFTALYFGLTTLTTVGFGDIAPVTFQGRLIVMGSILAGVAIIPAQAADFVQALLDFQTEQRLKLERSIADAAKKEEEEKMQLQQEEERLTTDTVIKPKSCFANFETTQVEICPKCLAREHRKDASFCYKCGQKFF